MNQKITLITLAIVWFATLSFNAVEGIKHRRAVQEAEVALECYSYAYEYYNKQIESVVPVYDTVTIYDVIPLPADKAFYYEWDSLNEQYNRSVVPLEEAIVRWEQAREEDSLSKTVKQAPTTTHGNNSPAIIGKNVNITYN